MPWIRIASEYTKIYEAWSLSTDNAHGRKHCFNVKYWDHIPSTRIGMNKIMSVYTARKKTISLPEKAKTKIILNLCSKRNIYKAAKNIGTAKYVLFCIVHGKTWDLLSNLTHSTGLNIKINTHFQFLTTTGSHLVYLLSIYCWYR